MNLFAALVTVGVILFSHFFIKTTMGMAMRATFQDKDVAALVGVHIDRVFSFTFMFGADWPPRPAACSVPYILSIRTWGKALSSKRS